MSKRIEVSTIIYKPIEVVWDEVKIMKNHVNWMQDAAKIDFLSENEAGIDTKMKVLTKVGPFTLNDIITVTTWEEMNTAMDLMLILFHATVMESQILMNLRSQLMQIL